MVGSSIKGLALGYNIGNEASVVTLSIGHQIVIFFVDQSYQALISIEVSCGGRLMLMQQWLAMPPLTECVESTLHGVKWKKKISVGKG